MALHAQGSPPQRGTRPLKSTVPSLKNPTLQVTTTLLLEGAHLSVSGFPACTCILKTRECVVAHF